MLLRTLLLFLCVSSGLCATLGLFQMQKDEAQDAAAVLDNTVEVSDGTAQDTEATTDDTSNDPSLHVEEGLLEQSMTNDIQIEADKDTNVEVDAPVVDPAPAQEVETDSDNNTEDVPVVEVKETETPVDDQPSHDVPVEEVQVTEQIGQDQSSQDVPVEKDQVAEELVQDQASQDVPIVEITETEAPIQEQPSQEENNEIKPIQTEEVQQKPEESHSGWGFNSIRSSFQNMHGYFDSLVELVGGRNGVCEYRCRYGEVPAPRPGYQLPEPNGCSSSLVGFQLDLGIPAMTQCCNQLDSCYDTCGTSKYDCDSRFRSCLHDICSDLKKSLGLGTQVQTCESMADGLFNTVWTLGCRPYMNSQRAACICYEEAKDEL